MRLLPTVSAQMRMATVGPGGCVTRLQQTATPYSTSYSTRSQSCSNSSYGAIESMQVTRPGNTTSGTGAVAGGLVGGLLGNQIGNGRTAATVVGAVSGAMVGNNIEQNSGAQAADRSQIRVRLDNGDCTTIVQHSIDEMRAGNRVRNTDRRAYRD